MAKVGEFIENAFLLKNQMATVIIILYAKCGSTAAQRVSMV